MVTRKSALRTALLSAVIGLTSGGLAHAELPTAGTTMDAVRGEFGEPNDTTLPIGQPEITRWVYESFNVVFENDRVVEAFPRIESVEKRSHAEIPERPEFTQKIDQSINKPSAATTAPTTSVEATSDSFEQKVEVKEADEAAAALDAPEAVTSSQ